MAAPAMRSNTIGVTLGCAKLQMPPFAVDMIDAQGSGDVSDAVIALRGKILNDFAGDAQPETSVHFVAVSPSEAAQVAAAVAPVNGSLADRFKMVPGSHYRCTVVIDMPADDGEALVPSEVVEWLSEHGATMVEWHDEDMLTRD